jgi:dTDP-4-dehydrorhamnose 3,5-epimerase
MGEINLSDIIVTPLARIITPKGDVMHGIKNSDNGYVNFGEAYFSWIDENAVKAWKRHKLMTMNIIVPLGKVRLVFYNEEEGFRVEDIGTDNYVRLTVPPGIWFGFQGLGMSQNLLLNIASILHDPLEVERREIQTINYKWKYNL